jgi:hypothetical protein
MLSAQNDSPAVQGGKRGKGLNVIREMEVVWVNADGWKMWEWDENGGI